MHLSFVPAMRTWDFVLWGAFEHNLYATVQLQASSEIFFFSGYKLLAGRCLT